ncbi:MAG: YgjP-like metallopeptidase domain-containing protein [Bacteroidota bacterium]
MNNTWAGYISRRSLTFDVEVLDLSPQKRNKIIVHELLHLRYPTHNKMFHRMMERYLKGYKIYTNLLFRKAAPDPDFKYFSKANALYLSRKAV